MIALSAIVFVANAQKSPSKVIEDYKIEQADLGISIAVVEEIPTVINYDEVVTATFVMTSSAEKMSAAMFQKLWEPVGDDYTYYYKEYETVYCGICPGGTLTAATGRCKSTSGTIYSCSAGM